MIDSPADKFAQASLKTHSQKGTFIVGIASDEEGEAVTIAFQGLGCKVEPQPFEGQLVVTAPSAVA